MTDPALRAAHALADCIAAYRDLLGDVGFATCLPAFEQLRVALPNPAAVDVPQPRRASADDLPFPLEREVRR